MKIPNRLMDYIGQRLTQLETIYKESDPSRDQAIHTHGEAKVLYEILAIIQEESEKEPECNT